MTVIDMHSHFLPESWPDLTDKFSTPNWPWLKHTAPGKAMVMKGSEEFRPVSAAVWDPEVRLADMDRNGIDVQIMSATPLLFSYGRPSEQAAEVSRIFNDLALDICARGKGRLKALCQVPLQDTDLACTEVSRAMTDGHLGVQIGNHVGNKDLDDDGILTFLHHCADIGAPVLVHPWDMMGAARMHDHMLPWLVGMPVETHLSITTLILSGALQRLPKTLKLCFAHGGGSFAFLLGRIDNAWKHRDIVRKHCPELPSSYTDRFYVDSAVFDEKALDLLVAVIGADRIMLGSDYPYPLGEQNIGQLVRNSPTLDDKTKAGLLGVNAQKFFHFNQEHVENSLGVS